MVRTTLQNPTPEPSPEPNSDIATIIAQQLHNILPQIITQVTANVNNANRGYGNGENNGCSHKTFTSCNPKKEWNTKVQARGREDALSMTWNNFKALLVEKFCPSNKTEKLENEFLNHTMVGANHVVYTVRFHELAKLVPHLVTLESSILTDEAVHCGTLTKGNDKSKEIKESSKQGSTWKDNKKAKIGSGFVATVPPKNDNVNTYPKCAKCYTFHPEDAPYGQKQRACYECGSLDHLRYDCPKWEQATGKARNPLAFKGNKNTQNNRSQARGKAFKRNAVEALQDPKVVTSTFSLNNQFPTVLFDYGADFSFISPKFAPLLNVEHSIINPGYLIEIVDDESVEVDRVIRDCKLELENSLFAIDLIQLGHGRFDVIVGMDGLPKNKAVIMCHEKVVEIPIKEGGILRVHGEHFWKASKALMNA
nr:hypothetical protein [Tanacetum cinerariifolium]